MIILNIARYRHVRASPYFVKVASFVASGDGIIEVEFGIVPTPDKREETGVMRWMKGQEQRTYSRRFAGSLSTS